MSDQEANAENKTAVSLTSAEEVNQKLSQLFGEEIAKGFEGKPWIADCRARTRGRNEFYSLTFSSFSTIYLNTEEEINCPLGISDLLRREADSAIFVKLGLTYGKALLFRREFEKLMPQCLPRGKMTNAPTPPSKPSMGDMASFSPELKRLYLSK